MQKRCLPSPLLALTCLALRFAANETADAAEPWGGSLGVVSDYVFRGLSQSDGNPALQGNLYYQSSFGWTLGLFASSVKINAQENDTVELDAYLAYRWNLAADWTAKMGVVRYAYPWYSKYYHYDYDELIGSLAYLDTVTFTVAWSWDASRYSSRGFGDNGNAVSSEIAFATPLKGALMANFGIGYYDLKVIDSGYAYWNTGLGYEWRSWHADLTYIGASHNAARLFSNDTAGNRLVATLLKRF